MVVVEEKRSLKSLAKLRRLNILLKDDDLLAAKGKIPCWISRLTSYVFLVLLYGTSLTANIFYCTVNKRTVLVVYMLQVQCKTFGKICDS